MKGKAKFKKLPRRESKVRVKLKNKFIKVHEKKFKNVKSNKLITVSNRKKGKQSNRTIHSAERNLVSNNGTSPKEPINTFVPFHKSKKKHRYSQSSRQVKLRKRVKHYLNQQIEEYLDKRLNTMSKEGLKNIANRHQPSKFKSLKNVKVNKNKKTSGNKNVSKFKKFRK